jgi:hypothetical protein
MVPVRVCVKCVFGPQQTAAAVDNSVWTERRVSSRHFLGMLDRHQSYAIGTHGIVGAQGSAVAFWLSTGNSHMSAQPA